MVFSLQRIHVSKKEKVKSAFIKISAENRGDFFMKWNTNKAAITGGIVWGGCLFVLTLLSVWTGGYAKAFLEGVGGIYPGYTISLMGSVVGAVYGFFDMLVGVYITVWVYKMLGK